MPDAKSRVGPHRSDQSVSRFQIIPVKHFRIAPFGESPGCAKRRGRRNQHHIPGTMADTNKVVDKDRLKKADKPSAINFDKDCIEDRLR